MDKESKHGEIFKNFGKIDEKDYPLLRIIFPIMLQHINFITTQDAELIEKICGKDLIDQHKVQINDNSEDEQALLPVQLDRLLSQEISESNKIILVNIFFERNCIIKSKYVNKVFKYVKEYDNIIELCEILKIPDDESDPYLENVCKDFKFTINDKQHRFGDYLIGESYEIENGSTTIKFFKENNHKLKVTVKTGSDMRGHMSENYYVKNGSIKVHAYGSNFNVSGTSYMGFDKDSCREIAKEEISKTFAILDSRVHLDAFNRECERYNMFMKNLLLYETNRTSND
jgi:hypothetical protein